jgi:uncharacterized protein DUF5672
MITRTFLKEASKLVAVVVPMSNRSELTPEEEISLRHLLHFLGDYDKFVVIPRHLQVNFPGFRIKRFKEAYFGSAKAHSRLLLSPTFYRAFLKYKFILIYHLDALVFSDQLKQWCDMDYDFIGPPWIKHKEAPYTGLPLYEGKVGNGGFSLRKVHSFLKVIYSQEYFIKPSEYWKYYTSKPWYIQCLNLPKKYLKRFLLFNNARLELSRYGHNEEAFWTNRAKHYYPDFKIPSVNTALRFGFECVPRYCFEKNNHTLPFGCHAWQRYDREFWEPYLLK